MKISYVKTYETYLKQGLEEKYSLEYREKISQTVI